MRRLCLLATVVIAGCMSWQSPKNLQEQLRAPDAPGTRVRVTTDSGTSTVEGAVIRGDSLVGARVDSGAPYPAAYPLAGVHRIEVQRTSVWGIAAMIGGAAAVSLIATNAFLEASLDD